MTFSAWLAWAVGKRLDLDGMYGAQCMDLINSCLISVWKVPPIPGDAVDVPRNRPNGGMWVPNSPTNAPLPGDVIAFAASSPTIHTAVFAHTSVAVVASVMDFCSIDQNWPAGASASLVHHTYDGVLGWWHNMSPRR